ncbi:MAG: glycoside hydrolase family 43 protein [Lachnospiraceae bacterium]|nr:glycoside hydrolase family 43 protein [Lachnospiraceae bacterium]
MKIKNPVVKGFYPDPSICYAEGKFYMVCSSMQFFPGVPLFESEDLVHFKQIGNVLSSLSQVDLHNIPSSGGVFAPTIRYNNGRFYMVTTNDSLHKNFYVYTDDIYGEWSEPIFVDQGGIDPSLFFEDGKTYFMSNGDDTDGRGCIFQSEIDIETGERLTEPRPLWNGNGGRYLESPHMYKFGRYYYLMAAEGGTEFGHMITYARSANIYGPFTPYKGNPILTNRDFGGHQTHIMGIGHGDLVTNSEGETFMVCLGFRIEDDWVPYHHLGREVFLIPVKWDGEWFTAGVSGNVYEEMDIPVDSMVKPGTPDTDYSISMPFNKDDRLRLSYVRDYKAENYDITDDSITLTTTEIPLTKQDSPTFVGVRQSEFDTELSVNVTKTLGEAGLTIYMDDNEHYDIARVYVPEKDMHEIIVRYQVGDATAISYREKLHTEDVVKLIITSTSTEYEFAYSINGQIRKLCKAQSKYLSTEVAGGFTGVFGGVYATSKVMFGYEDYDVNPGEKAVFTEFNFRQG